MKKPLHLTQEFATQFQDAAIVDSYRARPEYPPATFQVLANLMSHKPGRLLDVGCGTGFIARNMTNYSTGIDAIDFSEPMINEARSLPGGDHPAINWQCAPMEEAILQGPYSLITAGDSLHWMDWSIVMPKFRSVLGPGGTLAIVGKSTADPLWQSELTQLIGEYSTNRVFETYDLIAELESRNHFSVCGKITTPVTLVEQSLYDYIESFHSRNGFSRDRLSKSAALEFDAKLRDLVRYYQPEGAVELRIAGTVIWGLPG